MKKGFTLAEVLITLAIIGVVATLTMPNLIGNYQNRVLMTQLQKTLNTVQNAAMKYMEETTSDSFTEITKTSTGRKDFLKNYLDSVNICTPDTGYNNCLSATYSSFDKANTTDVVDVMESTTGYPCCATLTSGETVCLAGTHIGSSVREIFIDDNGVKAPNVSGKDVFYTGVHSTGKMYYNRENGDYDTHDNGTLEQEANGDFCTTSQSNPKDAICLPYIISHGWEFKF